MKTLIVQQSPPHTASTVLVNILYGLIPSLKNKPIDFREFKNENYPPLIITTNDITVIKTHTVNDFDKFMAKYSSNYKIYFICSERKERNIFIDDKYKSYNNVIVFSFEELNETPKYSEAAIVQNIYRKIHDKLNIELIVDNGINRLKLMNQVCKDISEKQFSYYDKFFHIHGSHRNRPTETKPAKPANNIANTTNKTPAPAVNSTKIIKKICKATKISMKENIDSLNANIFMK